MPAGATCPIRRSAGSDSLPVDDAVRVRLGIIPGTPKTGAAATGACPASPPSDLARRSCPFAAIGDGGRRRRRWPRKAAVACPSPALRRAACRCRVGAGARMSISGMADGRGFGAGAATATGAVQRRAVRAWVSRLGGGPRRHRSHWRRAFVRHRTAPIAGRAKTATAAIRPGALQSRMTLQLCRKCITSPSWTT